MYSQHQLFIFLNVVIRVAFTHNVDTCRYLTIPICDGSQPTTPSLTGSGNVARGPMGPPGKTGPRGYIGNKGEKGEQGVQGPKGNGASQQEIERINQKLEEMKWASVKLNGVDFCQQSTAGIHSVHGQLFACDGDGWTVIQRRRDGSVNFERNWVDYRDGFGSLDGEFWFGLENIYRLMFGRQCRLRVDLKAFTQETAYAEYSSFSISDGEKKYRLSISGYSGTAGDSIAFSDGMKFSTKDQDNDIHSSTCARNLGGWWFKNCFRASPNGVWGRSSGRWTKILWYTWKGDSTALDSTTMKIRCN